MSVKVAIPRDIESSFDSSIAMPDSVAGEQEWIPEDQRSVVSGVIELAPNDSLFRSLDSVMTYDHVYTLYQIYGGANDEYRLIKSSIDGEILLNVAVPKRSAHDVSFPSSLLFKGDGVISVGRINVIDESALSDSSYSFDFVTFNASDLSFSGEFVVSEMEGVIKYNEYIVNQFKFDGEVLILRSQPLQDGAVSTQVYSDGLMLSSTSFDVLCHYNGFILTLAQATRVAEGERLVDVNYYNYNFDLIRSETAKIYDPPNLNLRGITLSTDGSNITIASLGGFGNRFVITQLVDGNMVNVGSYKKGNEVIKSSTKRKYRCAVDATFDDPEIGVKLSPPTWTDIGSTNRFAALDSNTSQRSLFTNSGYASCFVTNPVDTVGIFGLSGVEFATVSIRDNGMEIYSETKSGLDSEFADVEIRDITFSVPPFSNVEIFVSFEGDNIRIGRFAVGVSEAIGRAVPGTELGDIDYSILEFDEFGNTRYVPRPIVSFHTFQVDVDKQKSLSVARKLQSIGGKDAMWSADVGLPEPLVAIGKCERFPITYDNPTIVSYTVKVRGTA